MTEPRQKATGFRFAHGSGSASRRHCEPSVKFWLHHNQSYDVVVTVLQTLRPSLTLDQWKTGGKSRSVAFAVGAGSCAARWRSSAVGLDKPQNSCEARATPKQMSPKDMKKSAPLGGAPN